MRIALGAVAALSLVISVAASASAYDAEKFAYAAGHMIMPDDIVKPLTSTDTGKFIARSSDKSADHAIFNCSNDLFAVAVAPVTGGEYTYSMSYEPRGRNQPQIEVDITQFTSSSKANSTFKEIKRAAASCAGLQTGSDPDDDGSPTADRITRFVTTGTVPLATIAGVPSIFVKLDNQRGEGTTSVRWDFYTVFTLVNDVIIATNCYTNGGLNLTPALRKAVNQTAFNAASAWLD